MFCTNSARQSVAKGIQCDFFIAVDKGLLPGNNFFDAVSQRFPFISWDEQFTKRQEHSLSGTFFGSEGFHEGMVDEGFLIAFIFLNDLSDEYVTGI